MHRLGWRQPRPITFANLSPNICQELRSLLDTPTVPLLKEADPIPLSVYANLAAAKLRERALRHTQETPIANAAVRSVEPCIRCHGAGGAARRPWRDSATAISERLGLDNFSSGKLLSGLASVVSLSPSTLVPCRVLQMIPIQHPGSLLQLQPCPVYLQQM